MHLVGVEQRGQFPKRRFEPGHVGAIIVRLEAAVDVR